jgi:hypothetical protein
MWGGLGGVGFALGFKGLSPACNNEMAETSLVFLFICRLRDLAIRNDHDDNFSGTELGKDRRS